MISDKIKVLTVSLLSTLKADWLKTPLEVALPKMQGQVASAAVEVAAVAVATRVIALPFPSGQCAEIYLICDNIVLNALIFTY